MQLLRDFTSAQEAKKAHPRRVVSRTQSHERQDRAGSHRCSFAGRRVSVAGCSRARSGSRGRRGRADPQEPYMEAARLSGAVSGAAAGIAENNSPEPAPVEPPTEQPGAAYVRAVDLRRASPRPTTAQELFARTGTGWVPPESEYRLADKTA